MEFLKNLFTNDNSIVGLCALEEDRNIGAKLDFIFTDYSMDPPVNLMYRNREHLKNIFGT